MITKNGVIKKTLLTDFEYQRKGGKIAIGLDEGDELVSVLHTNGGNDVIIASHEGHTVRFSEENVRAMGRPARGVKGMSLRDGDYIKGVAIVEEGKALLKKWGIPERFRGVGHCILGYAAEAPAPAKPRKADFIHRV